MTPDIHYAGAAVAADHDLGPLAGPAGAGDLAALLRRYRSARSAVVVGALQSWIRDAEADLPAPERRGIVLGTAAGAGADIDEFLGQTVRLGDHLVNPALFPMTVHNAVSGNAAIAAQCQGPNVVVSAGDQSVWSALAAAHDLLRDGSADLVFVGGFESVPSSDGAPATVAVITAISTDPAALGRAHLGSRPPAPGAEPPAAQPTLAALVGFARALAPPLVAAGDRARQEVGAS